MSGPVSREALSEHLIRVAIRTNTGHVDELIDAFVSSLLDSYSIAHKSCVCCGKPAREGIICDGCDPL